MKKRKSAILGLPARMASEYQSATKGLQNYGQRIASNMKSQGAQPNSYNAANPFPNPLSANSYKPLKKAKKK